jgi:hypothetical protein
MAPEGRTGSSRSGTLERSSSCLNTSSNAYGGRLMRCGKCNLIMDRDVVAVLNLQMRGAGFPQRALNELIEREGPSRGNEILLTSLGPNPPRSLGPFRFSNGGLTSRHDSERKARQSVWRYRHSLRSGGGSWLNSWRSPIRKRGCFCPLHFMHSLDIAALLIVLFGVEESGKRGDLAAIPFLWWLGASA